MKLVVSSGVMWTSEVKEGLLDLIPQAILIDAMGSTEGAMGSQITCAAIGRDGDLHPHADHKVFTEDDREVVPGSEEIGMVRAAATSPSGITRIPRSRPTRFGSSTECATRSPATLRW